MLERTRVHDSATVEKKAEDSNRWEGFTDQELKVMRTCFGSPSKTRLFTEVKNEQKRRERMRRTPIENAGSVLADIHLYDKPDAEEVLREALLELYDYSLKLSGHE